VNIPLSDSENIQGLLTNNHILKKEQIEDGSKIEFQISSMTHPISLIFGPSRFRFTDEKLDVTFIEIFSKDFNLDSIKPVFLNICEKVELKSFYHIYHYSKGQELSYNQGYITELNDYEISYKTSNEFDSPGSPILNQQNEFISILHSLSRLKYINYGTYIKSIISAIQKSFSTFNN
jgi:hypothetical protein